MTALDTAETPLQKERRLFGEGFSRFANALVNSIFDLSPQAAFLRLTWLVILFFLTGFIISWIYYPLGLWFQHLQNFFLFFFNSLL